MPDSQAVVELKKNRLDKHLVQVEEYLTQWLEQLSTPEPFSRHTDLDLAGVQVEPYQPALEQDPDVNHMLRKHVGSRVFWKHHAEWTLLQARLARVANNLVERGNREMGILVEGEDFKPTLWFLVSALEDAFSAALATGLPQASLISDAYGGVLYRSNKIETASPVDELERVSEALGSLTNVLKKAPDMPVLVELWQELKGHEASMIQIGGDTLKASDVFHPCRFCRKLFK